MESTRSVDRASRAPVLSVFSNQCLNASTTSQPDLTGHRPVVLTRRQPEPSQSTALLRDTLSSSDPGCAEFPASWRERPRCGKPSGLQRKGQCICKWPFPELVTTGRNLSVKLGELAVCDVALHVASASWPAPHHMLQPAASPKLRNRSLLLVKCVPFAGLSPGLALFRR